MKKDLPEYLGFEDEMPKKVGRPKLADKETKKKSLIIAGVSFFAVILLLIFGYGTLVGFNNQNLLASINKNDVNENILIDEINPLVKDITLKVGTKRKVYLTILPASASNKEISYTSSDDAVAQVDNEGKVTALKEGVATIRATTTDGTNKTAEFNITVIKDASGKCSFSYLGKTSDGINYQIDCDNAKVKEIQYKVGNGDYEKLLTTKLNDNVKFSSEQRKKKITLKVVYYPNNSKVTKYSTKTINTSTTTKEKTGTCNLTIKEVNANSCKYDITCENATVTKIAYKIGNGSYVGIDSSSLADTILFEESDVTRQLYFNIEYQVDGAQTTKTITKASIIEKSSAITNE